MGPGEARIKWGSPVLCKDLKGVHGGKLSGTSGRFIFDSHRIRREWCMAPVENCHKKGQNHFSQTLSPEREDGLSLHPFPSAED